MLTLEEAQLAIKAMDVPEFKRDITRSPNIMWLLENLHVRNAKAPVFANTMRYLLAEAMKRNLLKKKEVARIEELIVDARVYLLHPHQKEVMDAMRQKAIGQKVANLTDAAARSGLASSVSVEAPLDIKAFIPAGQEVARTLRPLGPKPEVRISDIPRIVHPWRR